MSSELRAHSRPIAFALFTLIAGVVGWFASFELLTEYIKTLQDPGYIPNCSVSILVTCGPNMASWQGSLLGFSNTIIGVSAFVAPIAVGVALLAGARFSAWFWALYQVGLLAGFTLICWLFSQSVFVIGTLCPWCMVVWTVMIPLWWVSFFRPYAVGDIPVSAGTQRFFAKCYSWSWVVILVCYAVIAFVAQLQLNWIAEFSRM
ncbi:vitamin K epoxide reductase family protein [Leucobacter japonicus]|uniref:vitamin K epoxide reductase family protein n=1 Tax=Leucobacter japonicus TaxID=1461259 RepID=UPI0006A75A40|nr:vitamin K epoxide reductase family protein [Leucobacter japonicus]